MQKNTLKSIAVYCGSNMGAHANYGLITEQMAHAIVESDLTLIYGGAKVGLMGILANTVLKLGGKVIGVIPRSLVNHEVAHESLTDLHVVGSMHERKALMADMADGFVMLPGGPGSLEEFFEIMTWAKLGYHHKPIGILNINRFYDLMLQFLDHMVDQRFLHAEHRDMILVDESPQQLMTRFTHYQAPEVSAWLESKTA